MRKWDMSRFFAVSFLALACSSDPANPGNGGGSSGGGGSGGSSGIEDSLEIFSWWVSGGEADALQAVVDLYQADNEGVEVTNAAAETSTDARQLLADRMKKEQPPDSFQAIAGADLLSWVKDNKMDAIDDIAKRGDFENIFPKPVLDILRGEDGKLYGVPVNIERDNNLYYNTAILAEHSIEPPASLDDFLAACATLQEADVIPLTVPAAGWVLALVTFETLMPAVNGGDFYTSFFAGKADPAGAEIEELFSQLNQVLACSNVAAPDTSSRWDTAGDLVYDGQAAMFVMGDWAKGYFEGSTYGESETARDPWTINEDFGVVAGLGSGDYFTFNSAVFGLPSGAKHPNAASAWLETIATVKAQTEFNERKGSVPANLNVPADTFDDAAGALAAFQDENVRKLPGYAALTPLEFQLKVNPALLVFAVGGVRARAIDPDNVPEAEGTVKAGNISYIQGKLKAAYGLL